MMDLLLDQRRVSFDAVAAVNDTRRWKRWRFCRRAGYVCRRMCLSSGSTIRREPCGHAAPDYSSVAHVRRGQQAAELLLAMLAGEPVPEQVLVPTRLIVRQSCGCLDPLVAQARVEMPPSPPLGRLRSAPLERTSGRSENTVWPPSNRRSRRRNANRNGSHNSWTHS